MNYLNELHVIKPLLNDPNWVKAYSYFLRIHDCVNQPIEIGWAGTYSFEIEPYYGSLTVYIQQMRDDVDQCHSSVRHFLSLVEGLEGSELKEAVLTLWKKDNFLYSKFVITVKCFRKMLEDLQALDFEFYKRSQLSQSIGLGIYNLYSKPIDDSLVSADQLIKIQKDMDDLVSTLKEQINFIFAFTTVLYSNIDI